MNRLSISLQLRLLGLVFIAALIGIIGWTTLRFQYTQTLFEQALELSTERLGRAIRMEGYVHTNVARIRAGAASTDESLEALLRPDIKATEAAFVKDLQAVEALPLSAAETQALNKLKADTGVAISSTEKIRQLKQQGQLDEARRVLQQDFNPAAQGLLDAAGQFQQLQRQAATELGQSLAQSIRRSTMWFIFVGLVVAACVFALLEMLRRQITGSLNDVVRFSSRVAGGDLTGSLTTTRQDELGTLVRSMAAMKDSLTMLVSQVRTAGNRIQTQASDITRGSAELSTRTEQAAANLEETAASMEELTATIGSSTEAAQQANQMASTAAQAAAQGEQVMGHVVSSMQRITDNSRQISDIIGVIDGIAFQTNILALNAAVEAARAGEQGRGFAVVASEVRALAGRSADAAKQIKALITTSVETVQAGSDQVAQAGKSMEEITHSVRRVSDLIGEITAASVEQRDGVGQVNQAVGHLEQMTQQNASMVQESASSAAILSEQAQALNAAVSAFQVAPATQGMAAPMAFARPAPVVAAPSPHMPAASPRPAIAAAPSKAPAKPSIAATPAKRPAPAPSATGQDDWESF